MVLVVCWSPKGGSGTSVVAAALAVQVAHAGDPCLLVDDAGGLADLLGIQAEGEGFADWLRASDDVGVDTLGSLEIDVCEQLRLLPAGTSPGSGCGDRRALAASVLAASGRVVVVDAGTRFPAQPWWPEAGTTTITVVRACYLGLRRVVAADRPPGPVVLIEEQGRVLRRRDVVAGIGDVAVALAWDPAVARAVDAGLLSTRMPRSLRPLADLVPAGRAGR